MGVFGSAGSLVIQFVFGWAASNMNSLSMEPLLLYPGSRWVLFVGKTLANEIKGTALQLDVTADDAAGWFGHCGYISAS